MKKFSAPGRRLHGRGDPPQAQALQHRTSLHRPQKTAGRNIYHAVDECRLMIMRTGDRQIAIDQSGCAHERVLFGLAAGSVEPYTLVAAEGTQAKFATDRQMSRADLVARKHDACELDPEKPRGVLRSLEVGAKGLNITTLLQAIEMREGMRADLLSRVIEDSPDE